MIEERAIELAEALESGKYKQCQGKLHDGEGYCCLGVACVLAGEEFVKVAKLDAKYCFEVTNTRENSYLSQKAQEYFDFYDPFGASRTKRPGQLTVMNDRGVPFELIAKYIRANWSDL